MSAQATFWLESQMGNQRLARQPQTRPLPVPLFGNVCYGPRRVDESDIAHSEFHSLIVLKYSRLSSRLEYCVVMLHTIEVNIPMRPLYTVGIATKVHCLETANASGTHPTAEGFWFYTAQSVPATKEADHIYKPVVI
jgi:hypothetical protein